MEIRRAGTPRAVRASRSASARLRARVTPEQSRGSGSTVTVTRTSGPASSVPMLAASRAMAEEASPRMTSDPGSKPRPSAERGGLGAETTAVSGASCIGMGAGATRGRAGRSATQPALDHHIIGSASRTHPVAVGSSRSRRAEDMPDHTYHRCPSPRRPTIRGVRRSCSTGSSPSVSGHPNRP